MTTLDTAVSPPATAEFSAEFAASRAALSSALATVGVVMAHTGAPARGVLLESHGSELWVRGGTEVSSVTVRIPDAAVAPGRMLLELGPLRKVLAALGKGLRKRDADAARVRLRVRDGAWVEVELAGTTVPLPLLEVEAPSLPSLPPVLARLERAEFTRELSRVLRAVGGDDTLPMFTGVKFDAAPAGLHVAATDRYRLTMGHVPAQVDQDRAPAGGMLLDGWLLDKMLRHLTGSELTVGYEPDPLDSRVGVSCGAVTVLTRSMDELIDSFPRCATHLPRRVAATVVTDPRALLAQTERAAAVLAATGQRGNPVLLSVSSTSVTVSPLLEEETERVRTPAVAAQVSGHPMQLRFAHEFLADALRSFDSSVTLHLQAPTKSALLTESPDGLGDATAFRHLLMPRRPT